MLGPGVAALHLRVFVSLCLRVFRHASERRAGKVCYKSFIIFVVAIFTLWSHQCEACYNYSDFEINDLASLQKSLTPILFSACRYDDGKLILIIPIGSKRGYIVEMGLTGKGLPRNPPVANDGKIDLLPTPKVTDILMGAQGAFALQQEGVDFLLRQQFTYLAPQSFDRLRTVLPSVRCPADFWQ